MPDSQSTTTRITRVMVERLELDQQPDAIDANLSLRDGLGLDSAALLDLVAGIEDEFGIEIDTEEITEERFESIATLARFVSTKT